MSTGSVLGIKRIFSYEFITGNFARSREFHVNMMGFVETHRTTPKWERLFGNTSGCFKANNARIVVTAPKAGRGYAAQYLTTLPPGVKRIAFEVENLDHTVAELRARGATFIHESAELRADETRHRFVTIATPIGLVDFTFIEIDGDPEDIPLLEMTGSERDAVDAPFTNIDHITINARTMHPICGFFEQVMDLRQFWSVTFHTPGHCSGLKGTGLSSRVMWDPASKIKFAVNEPRHPHYDESQIQTFVRKNHGPGIQHLALATDDIVGTVRGMRARGVEFLDTPDAYYRMLPGRLKARNAGPLREDLPVLQNLGILVDGQDGGYLLQIFLKDAALLFHEESAGPFFYEVLQRRGHDGFGEGNFRALFEAIELQEAVR